MVYHPETFKPLLFYQARERFLSGGSDPVQFLEQCLATVDQLEDKVQAWVVLNRDSALEAARASAQRYQEQRPLSAIDGMPIGIKDMIETRDMPTQMGSPAFKGHFPKVDTAAVQALRAAGAIILGKTVTTALAFLDPGPTRNPFDLSRTPGGSSSGSAAAVAARMVPAALGTQVIGSIIRPSSFCGNLGFKPTYGALHRGHAMIYSQSHLGVHAGCVQDVWSVAQVINQWAGGDPGSMGLYGGERSPEPIAPRRLALLRGAAWARVDSQTMTAFEQFLERLQKAGVEVMTPESNPLVGYLEGLIQESAELSVAICAWEQRANLSNLARNHPQSLGPKLKELLVRAEKITLDEHRLALLKRDVIGQAHRALATVADGIVTLSANGPAPNAQEALAGAFPTGDFTFSSIGTSLRAPAVNLPALSVAGMPVGVQLITQPHQDAQLLSYAQWYQCNP